MTKSFLFAAPLALAVGVLASAPASAAVWNPQGLRGEISQLDRQVDRAVRTGDISRREARDLQVQVDGLQSMYTRFARGGFNRGELAALNTRIDQVQAALRRATRDDDHRDSRRDRDDRYDRDDRSNGSGNGRSHP
ncbi:MAG: hypothetical protein KDE15_13560 [Erythrobacter sp.]|nr:hypothetical protein [Erythrobacter sp.]